MAALLQMFAKLLHATIVSVYETLLWLGWNEDSYICNAFELEYNRN